MPDIENHLLVYRECAHLHIDYSFIVTLHFTCILAVCSYTYIHVSSSIKIMLNDFTTQKYVHDDIISSQQTL